MTSCTNCGASLTPADMQATRCRYCGTVLQHYARAAEKVAVVQALLGDANKNGIPDALEGVVGPAMGAAVVPPLGAPVPPPGAPVPGGPPVGSPPPIGAPMGVYGAGPDVFGQVRRGVHNMVLIAIVVSLLVVLLMVGGAVAFLQMAP